MGIFLNNQIAINEVYFGKTKDIQELQYYLAQWRANAFDSRNIIKRYNSDPWRIKFEDKMCDIFGFANYELLVVPEKIVNAYTYNIGTRFDITGGKLQKAVMTTKDGFKYDKSYKFSCITRVYEGIFLNDNINDAEVLAIILHEIGHNFQEVMNEKSLAFTSIEKTIDIINHIMRAISGNIQELINLPFFMLNNTNAMSNINIKINRIIYNNKILSSIQNTKDFLTGKINSLFRWISLVMVIPSYISIILGNIINSLNPLSIFLNSIQYNDEKLADSFATMYGYGPELSSGLGKIGYKVYDSYSKINSILAIPLYIIVLPLDCHPDTITRMKTQVSYLEKELTNGVHDKATKQEIKNSINEINKCIDDIVNTKTYKLDDVSTNKFRLMYSLFIHKVLNFDFKESMSHYNDNYEEVERMYKKYKK